MAPPFQRICDPAPPVEAPLRRIAKPAPMVQTAPLLSTIWVALLGTFVPSAERKRPVGGTGGAGGAGGAGGVVVRPGTVVPTYNQSDPVNRYQLLFVPNT